MFDQLEQVDEQVACIRSDLERKEKDGTQVLVACLVMLTDYNKNTNSVEKFDQLRSCYGIDRKSHKWWHRIMFFFVDAAIVNTFIIHKLLTVSSPLTFKDFRRQVSEGLVAHTLVSKVSLPIELSLSIKTINLQYLNT